VAVGDRRAGPRGARRMLAEASQAEVDDQVGRFTAERNERVSGWRCAAARTSREVSPAQVRS